MCYADLVATLQATGGYDERGSEIIGKLEGHVWSFCGLTLNGTHSNS